MLAAVVHMLRKTAGLRRNYTGLSMRRTRLPIDKARLRPNPHNSTDGDDLGCEYSYGQYHGQTVSDSIGPDMSFTL